MDSLINNALRLNSSVITFVSNLSFMLYLNNPSFEESAIIFSEIGRIV